MHSFLLNVLTYIFTRIWGHLLIPVLLGSIFWITFGHWTGWEFVHWLAWVAGFLALGWVLTIISWVRFYWAVFKRYKGRD